MDTRKVPQTLQEAYELRDSSSTPEEWDFYQNHVYRLRHQAYRRRRIKTSQSVRRRERARAGGAWHYWWASAKRTIQRTKRRLRRTIERRPVLAFYVLTLAISWSLWVPSATSSGPLLPPEMPPVLLVVGGFGPSLAAIILTSATGGKIALRELLGRLLRWRTRARWYAVALLLPPALSFLAVGLYYLFNGEMLHFSDNIPWYLLPLYFLTIVLFVGPLQEEIGWRGYALPRLQARRSGLSAALILGLLWALWHLPLAWSGTIAQPIIPLLLFMLAVVGLSILFAWTYNGTRGSLLICLLLHASLNTTLRFVPILPVETRPLGPFLIGVGLLWAVAIAVVITQGPQHLARKPGSP